MINDKQPRLGAVCHSKGHHETLHINCSDTFY
jgi:hypothetical protein